MITSDYFKNITDKLMKEEFKDIPPNTDVTLNSTYPEHQNNYEYKDDEEKLHCTIDLLINRPPSFIGDQVTANKMHYEVTSATLGLLASVVPVSVHFLGHDKCVELATRLKAIIRNRHQDMYLTPEQRQKGYNQIKMNIKAASKKGFIDLVIETKYIINGNTVPNRTDAINL